MKFAPHRWLEDVRDSKISRGAKWMAACIMLRLDNKALTTDVTWAMLERDTQAKRTAVRGWEKELREAGYLVRVKRVFGATWPSANADSSAYPDDSDPDMRTIREAKRPQTRIPPRTPLIGTTTKTKTTTKTEGNVIPIREPTAEEMAAGLNDDLPTAEPPTKDRDWWPTHNRQQPQSPWMDPIAVQTIAQEAWVDDVGRQLAAYIGAWWSPFEIRFASKKATESTGSAKFAFRDELTRIAKQGATTLQRPRGVQWGKPELEATS